MYTLQDEVFVQNKIFPTPNLGSDEFVHPVGIGRVSALDVFRHIFPNVFRFADVIEQQYVDRCANSEAHIVTEDAGDRALRLENMSRSLDKHEAVEIFVLGEI